MAIPYHAYARGIPPAPAVSVTNAVAAATLGWHRASPAETGGKLLARLLNAVRGLLQAPASMSDTYAVRRAEDAATLHRMARELDAMQPALAAELRLLACRD
ncbi:MAG TPA: hypothetical protein VEC06_06915 [Paucimonas sp.]|nr:hypothetical protein [Paucimonas sp.]